MTEKNGLFDNLEKFSNKEQKEGKRKGLTDKEFKEAKNSHWAQLFESGVMFVEILSLILIFWIIVVLGRYTFYLWNDLSKLEEVFTNVVHYVMVALAAIGGDSLVKRIRS